MLVNAGLEIFKNVRGIVMGWKKWIVKVANAYEHGEVEKKKKNLHLSSYETKRQNLSKNMTKIFTKEKSDKMSHISRSNRDGEMRIQILRSVCWGHCSIKISCKSEKVKFWTPEEWSAGFPVRISGKYIHKWNHRSPIYTKHRVARESVRSSFGNSPP